MNPKPSETPLESSGGWPCLGPRSLSATLSSVIRKISSPYLRAPLRLLQLLVHVTSGAAMPLSRPSVRGGRVQCRPWAPHGEHFSIDLHSIPGTVPRIYTHELETWRNCQYVVSLEIFSGINFTWNKLHKMRFLVVFTSYQVLVHILGRNQQVRTRRNHSRNS